MDLVLNFTEFSRAYLAVHDLFDYAAQDVIEWAIIMEDTQLIEETLYNHYQEHPEHHHTVELLKALVPEPAPLFFNYEEIGYPIVWN